MELDARRINTAHHLWCRAVFMRRASRSILGRCKIPVSRYIFLYCTSYYVQGGNDSGFENNKHFSTFSGTE